MNEIRRIAKIYFEEFEGLHLYPSPKTGIFYAWLIALIAMLFVNAAFVFLISTNQVPSWTMAFPLASDIFAALMSQRVTLYRTKKIKVAMNLRNGFDFESLDTCKRNHLSTLLGVRTDKFLESAEEICRMRRILTTYDPTTKETTLESVIRYVYDSRSKDRILNLGLVVVGVVVTLAATTHANLDNLFDAYSSNSFWTAMALLEMIAMIVFLAWMVLFTLIFSLRNLFSQWRAKLSRSLLGGETEVIYMVCDLVQLHRRPPLSLKPAVIPPNFH